MDYFAACEAAATRQGLDPIAQVLADEGVNYSVEQTGGFCMAITVTTAQGTYGIIADPDIYVVFYEGDTWHEGPHEDAEEWTYADLEDFRTKAREFYDEQQAARV